MSFKEKMMNNMMEKQMSGMSATDKKEMMNGMMDKFFSSMSNDEKKELMQEMMPKMMGKMMGGGEGNPMMGMMQMMMGKKGKDKDGMKMPWDMCGEMMSSMKETANTAKFATPELRGLFEEWCSQVEQEIQELVKSNNKVDAKEIAEKLSLSEESVTYLLGLMAKKGTINYAV